MCFANAAFAQDFPKASINNIISSVNEHTNNRAVEKLYLQTDKPAYFSGDTLWFKTYLFDASYFNAAAKSGVMYAELANDSNRVMKRIMLPVLGGLAAGQIALDEKEIPQGGYILRAYTNWMRNFGEDYIFKKHIYIGSPKDKDWLANYNVAVLKNAGKENVQLTLKLNQFNKLPIGLREMQVRVMDKRKTWLKSDMETSIDGLLRVNFELPEKADPESLTLSLLNLRKSENIDKLLIPISLNRPEHIDLQFMPEGGNLIANLPAHVAFKAINEDGIGTNVSGKIYNSKHEEVTEFHATHRVICAFDLIPKLNETYSAKIKLPNGSYNTYALPMVKNTGITLSINNQLQGDSCEVLVNATPDVAATNNIYFLMGQARGVACYGASVNFNDGPVKFMVSKKIFPSGITQFILMDSNKRALNERIIYVNHSDNLNIRLAASKTVYRQRDSVALNIEVLDKNGIPVQGSFSLAITDDTQITVDSVKNGSIISQMLLTTDLKGNVEDPGYYLQSATDAKKWKDLDQLLLAQGWIGYDWDGAFKPAKTFRFAAEPEFLIQGKVTNMLNKPVAKSGVTLLSQKPFLIIDTVTNDQGVFTFKDIIPVDTAVFFIQSRNKKGKSFNVGIEMKEFEPPVFTVSHQRMMPWYVNIDTSNFLAVSKQIQLKKDQEKIMGGIVLKEVIITGKKVVKDSKNLNGAGEADYIIDEEELGKVGKTTLGDLLYKNIKGFGDRVNKSGDRFYSISGLLVHLIIDGMDTEFFRPESTSLYEYFKGYFDYYDAEEIKGVEVMTSAKYTGRYWSSFLHPLSSPFDHAFIEVTTRGGRGPFVKKSVGTYLYKPMPYTLPKKFYVPKYTVNSAADMTDIRSTIYWEPNIVTNEDGKATVTFYTADNPGTYSIIIEGSDMQGNLGAQRAHITIKK